LAATDVVDISAALGVLYEDYDFLEDWDAANIANLQPTGKMPVIAGWSLTEAWTERLTITFGTPTEDDEGSPTTVTSTTLFPVTGKMTRGVEELEIEVLDLQNGKNRAAAAYVAAVLGEGTPAPILTGGIGWALGLAGIAYSGAVLVRATYDDGADISTYSVTDDEGHGTDLQTYVKSILPQLILRGTGAVTPSLSEIKTLEQLVRDCAADLHYCIFGPITRANLLASVASSSANAALVEMDVPQPGTFSVVATTDALVQRRALFAAGRTKSRVVGRAVGHVPRSGKFQITVRLDREARRALKRRGRLPVTFRATFRPRHGPTITQRRRVTLR
jgi:hypothetical protein